TFQKMKAGANEVEEYLLEVAKNVVADTLRQHGGLLESDTSDLLKDRWFDFSPKDLVNLKQQGVGLFRFGIEGIRTDVILESDPKEVFRAYVYFRVGSKETEAMFSRLMTLLASLPSPSGFVD